MKASFKYTEDGRPAIVLTPESGDERVMFTVFAAQCSAPGFRVIGVDHRDREGGVDEIALMPGRDEGHVRPLSADELPPRPKKGRHG